MQRHGQAMGGGRPGRRRRPCLPAPWVCSRPGVRALPRRAAGGRCGRDGVPQHPEPSNTPPPGERALAPQRQGRVSAPGARRRRARAEPVRRTEEHRRLRWGAGLHGHAETAARTVGFPGAGARGGEVRRFELAADGGGIGMDWRVPASGLGLSSPGVKHARHRGDGHTRARGGEVHCGSACWRRRRAARGARRDALGHPRREFAEGDSRRPLGREQDRRVRGDDGHGATHPADARQVGGPEIRRRRVGFAHGEAHELVVQPEQSRGAVVVSARVPRDSEGHAREVSRVRGEARLRAHRVALQAETRARDSRRRALRAAV